MPIERDPYWDVAQNPDSASEAYFYRKQARQLGKAARKMSDGSLPRRIVAQTVDVMRYASLFAGYPPVSRRTNPDNPHAVARRQLADRYQEQADDSSVIAQAYDIVIHPENIQRIDRSRDIDH